MDDHLVSEHWALVAHQRKDVNMLLTAIGRIKSKTGEL